MDKITVGKFIAEQRKQLSLTQKQFAEQLGVTDKAVSRWETGKGYPDIETIEEIAKIFNVTINDVLSGKINKPEEKETAAEQNIIDALREILRVKKNGIIRTVVTALAFCFIIIILIPTLYLTLIPDLRKDNYILYNDRYYSFIDTDKIPPDFVLYAQQMGHEGKMIGREGLGLIRKTEFENVVYNANVIGRNYVYSLFKAEDIPSAKEALDYTVSIRYLGVTLNETDIKFSKDIDKITNFVEDIQATNPVDYFSINNGITESFTICMDCEEFAGYYLLGDVLICDNLVYFRPIDNMDCCYEMNLEQITE